MAGNGDDDDDYSFDEVDDGNSENDMKDWG